MKIKFAKTGLALFLAIAFVIATIPQYSTYAATPLPEGRTFDEGHNTGYIDWSGTVAYANMTHKDAICPSGCTHQMTRISNGSSISGSFERDLVYFEVMVLAGDSSSFGTITITACAASRTTSTRVGGGQGLWSLDLTVPAGCRDWSARTSAGTNVYVYSVDANYVEATATFTPSATFTSTSTSTATATSTETATATSTETATATTTATFTPTYTHTVTSTGTIPPTNTFTSTVPPATLTPAPVTPQVVIVTVPIIIINNTNNSENTNGSGGSGSSGSGGNGSFTAVTPVPWSQGQGGAVGFASGGYCSNIYVHVRVYVDYNNDGMMSPSEGVTGLQVFFLDQAYARLGSAYTIDGQTSFCLSPVLYGKTLYVDIPYLQRMASQPIPEDPTMDMELYFPGKPPTLPLYLP